jgi:O-antigen ligase
MLRYNRAKDGASSPLPLLVDSPMQAPRPVESNLQPERMPTSITPLGARHCVDHVAKWAAVVLGFSIPISVAVDNILLALVLGYWVLGGNYREKIAAIRDNPVAVSALALLGLYLAGTVYTIGSETDVLNTLGKAARLLLIAALLPLMQQREWRERAVGAFLASMLLSLVLSYLFWLGVMPVSTWLKGTMVDPVAFKAHITHNVFMAFTAFLFALLALDAASRRARLMCFALSAAALVNVLVMVPGRTGHVVVLGLLAYFLYRWLRAKGLAIAGVAVGTLAVVVAFSPDAMLHKRITLVEDEYQQWRAGVPPDERSSVGQRLAFLRNTVDVIRDNPVLGVGTGGFTAAYAAIASRNGDPLTKNPHNEFLMIFAELGVAGLVLLVYLFATQWWLAAQLPEDFAQGAARGLVLTIGIASVLSSTLVDHSEGMFFVYMSGVLFAGYGVRQREAAQVRAPTRTLGRSDASPAGR